MKSSSIDYITPVKLEIARTAGDILCIRTALSQVYVTGGGVRLALGHDCAAKKRELAKMLSDGKRGFQLDGEELVQRVYTRGGSIYLELTGAFYTSLLRKLLCLEAGVEPLQSYVIDDQDSMLRACSARCPRTNIDESILLARICYVQRRMWMLARGRESCAVCPDVSEIRRALLLCAVMLAYGGKTRILDACDALLLATRTKSIKSRPQRIRQTAQIALAAVKSLNAVYNNEVKQNFPGCG